ncbi:MAG TPA: MlaD family protein [Solirubrobacteraceae bacterium]|jgi:phospholipid/cholesterol/gamma-HCH transport system substrate-binding protein|nr:MlaD family protein [Solirubrobacteraceae bacterium]
MQKRAPTLGNLLVIILFVLSCFGLLMFLWESFGGPLPLKPKGYRFTVAFPRSFALAEQSDVRISGVEVGHVVSLKLNSEGRTQATLELAGRYAPIRANTHAILRTKTLLGETYVQLLPKGRSGPYLADGGRLANSQVEPSVTLDDILSLFNAKTRRDFDIWQEAAAAAIDGRGEDINASFAQLEPFVESANKLVTILDEQEGAVKEVVHNTGVVFNALASRDHQLEGSIVNGERTFHAAAEASQAFAEAFRELPAFEHNQTVALKETDRVAAVANPYLKELQPTERQLTLLLGAAKPFAPEFNKFLTALGPLTKAAKTDLPDLKKGLDLSVPVLENFRPVLHNLDPFLQYLGEYLPELQAFFANVTSASEASEPTADVDEGKGPKQHLLTTMQVLSPESLAIYPNRIGTDRSNAYPHSGVYGSLASGLPVFSAKSCANSAPSVNGPGNELIEPSLIEKLIEFKVANAPEELSKELFVNKPNEPPPTAEERYKAIKKAQQENGGNQVPAPGCVQQGPFTFNGETSQFPHATYKAK